MALDNHIIDYPAITNGYFSLGPFGKIGEIIGVFNPDNYRSVTYLAPGEFNVFSYLRDPYVDFGMFGTFLFMVIIGMWVGSIYNFSKLKSGWWTILYGSYIYAILMSFFLTNILTHYIFTLLY